MSVTQRTSKRREAFVSSLTCGERQARDALSAELRDGAVAGEFPVEHEIHHGNVRAIGQAPVLELLRIGAGELHLQLRMVVAEGCHGSADELVVIENSHTNAQSFSSSQTS